MGTPKLILDAYFVMVLQQLGDAFSFFYSVQTSLFHSTLL